MFGLDKYHDKERNYILFVRKLGMHRNQMTSYGVERQVDDNFRASSRESGRIPARFATNFD